MTMFEELRHCNKYKMEELLRHNKHMEKIEDEKHAIRKKQKAIDLKNSALEYKYNLVKRYRKMKEEMNYSDEQIVVLFPELAEVSKAFSNED